VSLDGWRAGLIGFSDVLTGLAEAGRVEEYLLVAFEHQILAARGQARESSLPVAETLPVLMAILRKVVAVAEELDLPLSTETTELLAEVFGEDAEITIGRGRLAPRPIANAPRGPTEFSVFVDESGSASFEEASQPVLCLAGVVIRDDKIEVFERVAESLLAEHGLPRESEFHAQEILTAAADSPFAKFSREERSRLLKKFVREGVACVAGVHHLSMLKALVREEFRAKMLAQGLNAYSHAVVWFAITLDRGCLGLTMPGGYKYFHDRTDAHRKDIGRIFRSLASASNPRLRLVGLKGQPTMLDSRESRLVQLADVIGYFLARYRQFEVPTFKPRDALLKHERAIRDVYSLIRPKLVDFISKDVHTTVDWGALNAFSLRSSRSDASPDHGRSR